MNKDEENNFIFYKDELIKFKYKNIKYDIEEIHPLLEFKRYKIIKYLNIFLKKHIHSKFNITELMLNSYIRNKNSKDSLLITSIDKEDLENTLISLNIKNIKVTNEIIKNINNKLDYSYNLFSNYYNSNTFIEEKKNEKLTINTDANFIYLIFRSYNIKLSKILYNKLKDDIIKNNLFNIDDILNFNNLVWCLIFRYKIIKIYNTIQLSVLPNKYTQLYNKYNARFEMFGSAINSVFPHYCSLFYDLEKYFGSKGQFFNLIPIEGFYTVNPPFNDPLMKQAIKKILYDIDNSNNDNNNLSFYITIPVWDIESRKKINNLVDLSDKNKEKELVLHYEYGKYDIFDLLSNSKYKQQYKLYNQDEFPFYDYIQMKKIYPTPIHVFLLSNKNI
jgi:hypothetical protein